MKSFLLLLFVFGLNLGLYAQKATISGTIVDDSNDEGIFGVNVVIKERRKEPLQISKETML